jgi:hypothetical protein
VKHGIPIPPPPAATGIAVIDLAAPDLDPSATAELTAILRKGLIETGRFRVVSPDYMSHALEGNMPRGIVEPEEAVRIGKTLDVEGVVFGEFRTSRKRTAIMLTFVNTRTGEPDFTKAVETVKVPEPERGDFVKRLCGEIAAEYGVSAQGTRKGTPR